LLEPERFPQTFLLRGQNGDGAAAGSGLVRGERHPQRTQHGTPVRGGDTKKGGKGGKGTWGAAGVESEPTRMRNGAIDTHDPNYNSSSGSDDEGEVATPPRATRPGSVPAPSALAQPQPQPQLQPQGATFKRVALEQLFGQAPPPPVAAPAASLPTPQLPVPQLQQQQQQGNEKRKSEQYAGGAHHNIPEASALPLPASLGGTPLKPRHGAAGTSGTVASPDAAARMEQSLKALLRINS
jgi:hypothetical protein